MTTTGPKVELVEDLQPAQVRARAAIMTVDERCLVMTKAVGVSYVLMAKGPACPWQSGNVSRLTTFY